MAVSTARGKGNMKIRYPKGNLIVFATSFPNRKRTEPIIKKKIGYGEQLLDENIEYRIIIRDDVKEVI